MSSFGLLTAPTQNAKLAKGMARGVMTFGLALLPAKLSGFEVCPGRSESCTEFCINTSGRGIFPNVQKARLDRTLLYFNNRPRFMSELHSDIGRAIAYAERKGFDAAFRPNTFSDVPWHRVPCGEHASIMAAYPAAPFYDYTKIAKRCLGESLPSNYTLTFSLMENNAAAAIEVLRAGGNVAVVCRDKETVARFLAQYPHACIDGDETDLRYLDPRGRLVLLYAKGKAKHDSRGFVRDDIADIVDAVSFATAA